MEWFLFNFRLVSVVVGWCIWGWVSDLGEWNIGVVSEVWKLGIVRGFVGFWFIVWWLYDYWWVYGIGRIGRVRFKFWWRGV